jgi:hypothetical protein
MRSKIPSASEASGLCCLSCVAEDSSESGGSDDFGEIFPKSLAADKNFVTARASAQKKHREKLEQTMASRRGKEVLRPAVFSTQMNHSRSEQPHEKERFHGAKTAGRPGLSGKVS